MSRNSVSIALRVFIFFAASAIHADDTIKPDANAPVIVFDGQTVTASNITPGKEAVFFAVGLVPNGYESHYVRWSQVVTDDDQDGTVTFDAGRAIPGKSIWVVADATNGHFAVAAPPNRPLRRIALDKKSLKKSRKGDVELFSHATPFLDFLYIHPGKGVWTVSGRDSHASDADGEIDGVATVALSSAKALTGEGTPKDFVPGGILVAIDLYRMNVVAERLDGQMLSEVRQ